MVHYIGRASVDVGQLMSDKRDLQSFALQLLDADDKPSAALTIDSHIVSVVVSIAAGFRPPSFSIQSSTRKPHMVVSFSFGLWTRVIFPLSHVLCAVASLRRLEKAGAGHAMFNRSLSGRLDTVR